MTKPTDKELSEVLPEIMNSIVQTSINETKTMQQEELEKYWFFRYDETKSKDWNLYKFSDSLEIYKRKCRQWEEQHNGSCCVVERVRDTYLMPKVKEFLKNVV